VLDFQDEINCSTGVKDLAAAVAWYETQLGCMAFYKDEAKGWASLSTPIQGFTLGLAQVEKPNPQGGWTPTFGVNDLEAERGRLEAAGVKFDGPTIEIPHTAKFATFYDPDGNPLMLSQKLRLPGRA